MYDKKYMTYELEIAKMQKELGDTNDFKYHVNVLIGNDETALYPIGCKTGEEIPTRIIYNPLHEPLYSETAQSAYRADSLDGLNEIVKYFLGNPQPYFEHPERYFENPEEYGSDIF
jgi:hypothetical protein